MLTRNKAEEILELNQQALENNEITKQDYENVQAKILTHVRVKNYFVIYIN
jgi:hypothetical protein